MKMIIIGLVLAAILALVLAPTAVADKGGEPNANAGWGQVHKLVNQGGHPSGQFDNVGEAMQALKSTLTEPPYKLGSTAKSHAGF